MLIRRIARPLLASAFIADGLTTLANPEPRTKMAATLVQHGERRLPEQYAAKLPSDPGQVVRVNAMVQVGAAALLAFGRVPRIASTVLAATLVPATAIEHNFWDEPDPERRAVKRLGFIKDVSLLGGLMIAASDTAGKPSLAWRGKRAAAKVSASLPLTHASDDSYAAVRKGLEEALAHTRVAAGHTKERIAELADTVQSEAPHWAETAKEQGADLAETVGDRSREFADIAKRRGGHLVEVAKVRGADLAETARERGADLAETARERGADFAGTARERGADFADTARGRGVELAEAARERGADLADTARDRGAQVAETARERRQRAADAAHDRGVRAARTARGRRRQAARLARDRSASVAETARDRGARLAGDALDRGAVLAENVLDRGARAAESARDRIEERRG
ncbi:DoxX family membrane protein [Nocardia yamanashiensis]|uniref:DoxX family membrane protein n=1 Tax=Nocardia yamanashiensis TaxID=209247 RepID=UPI001E602DF2|nr:DoxX family membrane protein [Nocardia yamanashiensis]UGT44720.1 DoxX family membrane protein [Nocardia yamanashiensis]